MKRFFTITVFTIALANLTGCQSLGQGFVQFRQTLSANQGTETAVCPPVAIVDELATYHQYKDPGVYKKEHETSQISMIDATTSCKISDDGIIVTTKIHFTGTLGPKGRVLKGDKPSFSYPYFIALAGTDGSIKSKDIHAVTLSYDINEVQKERTESIQSPITDIQSNADRSYKLYIGFQLPQEQLSHNRTFERNTRPTPPPSGHSTEQAKKNKKPDFKPFAGLSVKSPSATL